MHLKRLLILTTTVPMCCMVMLLAAAMPAYAPGDKTPAAVQTPVTSTLNSPPPVAAHEVPAQTSANVPAHTNTARKVEHKEVASGTDQFSVGDTTYPLRTYRALATPNDPYATQWWTTSTGLPTAWDYGNGNGTTIAVIDTGFALQHEEFSGRWLANSGEQGATATEADSPDNCTNRSLTLDKSCNAIDDDSNGFVDDVVGWDFYSDTPNVQAGKSNANGAAVSHGTGVAGIAAASGNNGVGIAGVSWGAKILPLQAMNDDGVGDTLTIARAVMYAADRGVTVINLSLGSDLPDDYLRGAIRYALDAGIIVVAAAGNDGCNCMVYPAQYPEVVAVGALTSAGNAASFSSYGTNLDIMAPGNGMRTTTWSSGNPTNAYAANVAGTSYASPFVAGLLANAKAKQPTATWGELVGALLSQADHKTLTATAPRSDTLGFGATMASNLMQRLSNPYSRATEYDFTLANTDTLDANTAQDCGGAYPGAPFYQVQLTNRTYYTISPLDASRQTPSTVTQKGYVCTGLPTDTVSLVRRLMSSPMEFSNTSAKVGYP